MKVTYTFKKTSRGFELQATDGHQIIINEEHPKFEWLSQVEADRVINVNSKGHFNSSKDYTGLYSAKPKASKPIKVKLTKLADLNFSDDLFIPMKSGTAFDKFISADGGFLPGSNIMCAGSAGVGKTTLLFEMLYKVQQEDPSRKVLFISAEMTQLDMARYLKRFPHWASLPILFMSDYTEANPQAVIESVLDEGWDLVLTDSFSEVNDTVKEACGLTRGKTEKWFLSLMVKHNQSENKLKKYTTFLTILQLSKGGQYVGSAKLKFMTTAMLEINWKGGENSSERYMEFTKNRLGPVNQKLYFNMEAGVNFDEQRYQRDLLNDEMIQKEREKLDSESNSFDELFKNMSNEMDEALTDAIDGEGIRG